MEFHLVINMDSLDVPDGRDVARELRKVANNIEHILRAGMPGRRDSIYSSNGNKVGRWHIKGSDNED